VPVVLSPSRVRPARLPLSPASPPVLNSSNAPTQVLNQTPSLEPTHVYVPLTSCSSNAPTQVLSQPPSLGPTQVYEPSVPIEQKHASPGELSNYSQGFLSASFDEERKDPLLLQEIGACDVFESDEDLSSLLPDWFLQESVILNFEPTKDNVTRVMTEIHQKAGFLRGLPPLELWRWAQKKRWEKATQEFVPYFEKAVLTPSNSVEFLKLCLRLLELPALALQQVQPEQKGISEGKAALDSKLRKVESLTIQNRLHAASKVLFSNGMAQPSDALFDRLQALHPALKEPIPDFQTVEDQFSLSPEQTCKALYKQCREDWNSPDPYGWNTSLLYLIRNVAHPPATSFFTLFSSLVSRIIDANVSDLVAFVFSGGSIIGLNKDDAETQASRLREGLEPRERPINQGSLFLKLAFDLALHSPAAQAAAKALRPIQQGVGAPRGMEVIAHVCTALYEQGFAILKMDATNGFQEIKRSSMHRAVLRRCPSLLSLFKKYYTKESLCFFNMESEVRVLRACEGARIGCKLSSFGFALTVQDLYETVAKQLARAKNGSCIKAATDDVIVVLKATTEKELFTNISGISDLMNKGASKVGLSFENSKALLLLPKDNRFTRTDWLPSGIGLRSNTFVDPKLRGMEIVGAPVGSADFCSNFVTTTLDTMLRHSESLLKLHPQSATKLLKDCVCAAPGYLAQVCHPNFTKGPLLSFDDSVWNLWLRILGDTGNNELVACTSVLERARVKAFLPSRFDGVGLRSWERTSAYAWFCSVASCIGLCDPDFDFARRSLKKASEDAFPLAFAALGGPSYLAESKFELIPVDEPEVLSDSTFYKDLFKTEPKLKMQHEFTDISSNLCYHKFLEHSLAHHSTTSEKIAIRSMMPSGVSLLSNLFTAKLTQKDTRLTKTEFTIVARQYVLLPPLKNNAGDILESKCGCQVQTCDNKSCKNKDDKLDSSGSHGLVCHPGVKAMRATLLEKALEKGFRQAGGNPTKQPSTYSLLGGHFTKEDLSSLFPGRLNQTQADERKKLAMKFLDIVQKIPRGYERNAELGLLRESFPVPSVAGEEDNNGIIRFDLKFPMVTPHDCPRELWFDHAIVQETAPTYAEATWNFLEEKQTNLAQDSPPFVKTKGAKLLRYSALISVVRRLNDERKLSFQPSFLFPVISSLGIMNEDMKELMKSMVQRFKDYQHGQPPNNEGMPAAVLKGRFKIALKNSVCFAILRGNALSVNNQGVNGGVRTPQ
jgi:Reverse transcriptase (RNA-dependent DNA polymerase)